MALIFAGNDQLIATKTRLEFHRQHYGQYGM
jgi:hypothetical protein